MATTHAEALLVERRRLKPEVTGLLVGMAVGCYRVLGQGAQGFINLVAFHQGWEVARWLDATGGLPRDPVEAVRVVFERLGLAEDVALEKLDENSVAVIVRRCNVCPKRVGGYDVRGTACPVPGLILGVVAYVTGCRADPRRLVKSIEWGVGEECRFIIPLPARGS